MQNWHKWLLSLALGLLGGICQAATNPVPAKISDYVRSGCIGLIPSISALQLTLNASNSSKGGPQ
jgi:hypothetical protein